jgi:hypothetical protein
VARTVRQAGFAKSRAVHDDAAMRNVRFFTTLLVMLLALIVLASLVVVFEFWRAPVEAAHPAMAQVVAIAAHEGKFGADRDTVVLRNDHGTGSMGMRFGEVRCHVGDLVPVRQQGTTLTGLPQTCR